MAVMEGLATYEIFKVGFFLVIIICCLLGAIVSVFYNMNKNYVSTTACKITSMQNFEQTLVYSVNNITYTKIVPPVHINNKTNNYNNNYVTSLAYAYPEGKCTLYYASANPNDFSVNTNPTTNSTIFSTILCIVSIVTLAWFLFLRSHKEYAGVLGGIDAGQTIFGSRRYYY